MASLFCLTEKKLDINTTAPFLQQNRKVLLTFLRAYMEGIQYTITHKAESLQVFFKYFRNPDSEALAYLYDDTAPRLQKDLRPNPDSVRSILDQIALDVGHNQIDWRLRTDPRVLVLEGVNARHLALSQLPGPVDIVTIGQYLQPSRQHLPVVRYVPPGEFHAWAEFGRAMGFRHVESGPLVRSSYHAADQTL